MAKIATQKQCQEYLKEFLAAEDFKTAVEAATKCVAEWDALYAESAKNMVNRTPDLFLVLAAYQAGMAAGVAKEASKHKPVQETLA